MMSDGAVLHCVLCDEDIGPYDAWVPLNPQQIAHHCCSLREVVGGIGHQIAHSWWCLIAHDPDAGFTRHQSAQLVVAMVDVLGIEEVTRRAAVEDRHEGDAGLGGSRPAGGDRPDG